MIRSRTIQIDALRFRAVPIMSESEIPTHLEGLKLSNLLCFAVYSANHAFNRLYKPILDELGLTYPQYVTMVTLWREDGLTVGQIGERILLETNTVTPLLEAHGSRRAGAAHPLQGG